MSARAPVRLALATAALAAVAAAILVAGSQPSGAAARRGAAFQRLLGGIGGGAAVDPSRCARAFDPRLADACSGATEPVPGTRAACPEHAGFPWPP